MVGGYHKILVGCLVGSDRMGPRFRPLTIEPMHPHPLPSLIVAALALLLLPTAALAQPDRRADLERIRGEIARLEGRLATARRAESNLASRLETVEVELDLQRQRLAEAVAERDLAGDAVEAARVRVEELEAALGAAREQLRRRMVGLYRLGRQGYLRLLLSIRPEGDDDLLPAIRTLRFLVERDAEAVRRYLDTRDRLAEEQERLEARRREAERWAAEETTREGELAAVQRRQRRLLARAREERARLAAEARQLEQKEQRLTDLIAALAAAAGTTLEGRPIQEFEGVLDWPLEGEVAVEFGPRLDPRYGTRVPHNGISIDVGQAETAAVYPGKVLFAAPLEGYGPTVVVLHPGRVFTLYAGLSSLRVSSEDVVSLGDVLGTASERLYFEIRVENRPQDPRHWLR